VNPANPLAGLDVAQLDGIFGAEHKRSPANLRRWGDLGLEGEWRERPIHVVAPPVTSIPALFFRRTVLGNSFKWNESLREFADEKAALEEVARDPSAIAYARASSIRDGVKMLPLAATAGAPYVALDDKTAADRSYPLSRVVIVAIDRAPGKPLDPLVHEFLRYVLSAEGQADVARDGAYVPLLPHDARTQGKRLD
jgi:phosphate transport system substrate-binding protein